MRLVFALYWGGEIRWPDGREYHRLALGLVQEQAYLSETGEASAYWPPGYPAFMAIFGAKVRFVKLVQVVLGTLVVFLIYSISRQRFDEKTSLLAAAFVAIYPIYVFASAAILSITLLTFLLTLGMKLSLGTLNTGSALRACLTGLTGTAAALTSASALPAFILIALWLLIEGERLARGRGLRTAAILLLTLGISMVPWTMRNHQEFGRFVPVSLNGGFNAWLGNHPDARAEMGNRMSEAMQLEYDSIIEEYPGEGEQDRAYWAKAREYIFEDPGRFIRLSLQKAINLWRLYPRPMTNNGDNPTLQRLASIFSYGLALPFAILGLVLSFRRWAGARLSLLLFLSYTVLHAVILSKYRFRLPLDALVLLFAAVGVLFAFGKTPYSGDTS